MQMKLSRGFENQVWGCLGLFSKCESHCFFFFFHRNYISLCAHNNNHLPPIPSLFSLKSKLCSWNYHEDERALKLKFSHVNNASIAYEKKKN